MLKGELYDLGFFIDLKFEYRCEDSWDQLTVENNQTLEFSHYINFRKIHFKQRNPMREAESITKHRHYLRH